jgi:DNA-binding MarR family transcriptional regulator
MANIYHEIKQSRPFDFVEEEAFVTLLRTTDMLRSIVEGVLDRWGISAEQYNVLRILGGAGMEGHQTLEVAARMISRAPNITRLLDKLISKGLVKRERSKDDRRVVVVKITKEGERVLKEANVPVREKIVGVIGCLSGGEIKSLTRCLDSIRANVKL